jgi:hypothetical protein
MNIITTFSKEGYQLYGKKWVESVLNFSSITDQVIIYIDFDLSVPNKNCVIKNFNDEFPEHENFKSTVTNFFNTTDKNIVIGHKTIKFSHKAFVINRELKNALDVVVWLDGDVETLSAIEKNDFKTILNNKFLSCQTEKQQHKFPHIESGILVFDCSHPTTKIFQKKFEEYYYTNKIFQLKKPYDGYVIGRVLKENDLDFVDLNQSFDIVGKNSHKDSTFQHPFLKSKFVHRIGQSKENVI